MSLHVHVWDAAGGLACGACGEYRLTGSTETEPGYQRGYEAGRREAERDAMLLVAAFVDQAGGEIRLARKYIVATDGGLTVHDDPDTMERVYRTAASPSVTEPETPAAPRTALIAAKRDGFIEWLETTGAGTEPESEELWAERLLRHLRNHGYTLIAIEAEAAALAARPACAVCGTTNYAEAVCFACYERNVDGG